MKPNVVKRGSITITDGVASGFSTSAFLIFPENLDVICKSFEMVFKVNFTKSSSTIQHIVSTVSSNKYNGVVIGEKSKKLILYLSTDGNSFFLEEGTGTTTLSLNTDYWIKLTGKYKSTTTMNTYTLSYSTDGINYVDEVTYSGYETIYPSRLILGDDPYNDCPWNGTIDLNESYIKIGGSTWWSGMVEDTPFNLYAVKRKTITKYYKEVVNTEILYGCFPYGSVYHYVKPPYNVGDPVYYAGDGSTKATSVSQLSKANVTIFSVNEDGTLGFGKNSETRSNVTNDPSGDLTSTTTELVESTKDDYDIVKTEGSFYSLRCGGGVKPNVVKIGSLTINNGIASGFSDSNYLMIPTKFTPVSGDTWQRVIKIKTGSDVTSMQAIIGCSVDKTGMVLAIENGIFHIYISSGTSWDIAESTTGSHTFLTNTTYWVKVEFTGSVYKIYYSLNGIDYILDVTVSNSNLISSDYIRIGDSVASDQYFLGSIDLTQSYIKINGELWWTGMIQNNNSYLLIREKN